VKKSRKTATAVVAEPTPLDYRRQHDDVALLQAPIVDVHGDYGQPYKAAGLYERLTRIGATMPMALAGVKFNEIYQLAAIDTLRAADMGQEIRYQGAVMGQVVEWARRRRDAAIDALGGPGAPAGLCAWYVLGEENTLREWAIRLGWNERPISEHVAKGILIGTLGALEGFFARGKKSA
jgi:hypothetical protein